MRHRIGIGSYTGLGNPDKQILLNDGTLNENIRAMLKDAIRIFPLMKKYEGCDYEIKDNHIKFGIEPAYQYEHLEIVSINIIKEDSFIQHGVAWGGWGSQLCLRSRFYSDYKIKGKFVKFIDRWHATIFNCKGAIK